MNEDKKILSTNQFPVVGIGASAGGLDAFRKLIAVIPEHSGMAYVLVQHLSPDHDSLLPELLQKVTKLPVLEITDEIQVEPNHVYVIPSNKMLEANNGVLHLSPREDSKRNLLIDLFFTSLAEVHQAHSIGVVLSGAASDGTAGLQMIKDYGGLTFAQNQDSAAYESMPNSAIRSGAVDFILPPEQIIPRILEIISTIDKHEAGTLELPEQDESIFKQIISLLRLRKGTDFTYYKQTTIRRRILRRMAITQNEDLGAYLKLLRQNKSEQDVLYQDLLIHVTSFFRDQATFENLCAHVIPQIMQHKLPSEPIRVWVAGCSTGEEAYSMAICLKEALDNLPLKVQIFATDISEIAIARARTGLYNKREVESIGADRLQEFFTKVSGNYQVNKNIRDLCVFAVHNFLKDPPFGKIDLVSCRNVLIYMEPYLQKKALSTFHYALQSKGYLLLGKSETVSSVPELFGVAAKNDKLFTRKDGPGRFMHVVSPSNEQHLNYRPVPEIARNDFQKIADDIVLNRYAPPGVVVNEAMDIVHFRGNTSPYLGHFPGKPSHNLFKMAKDGLGFELRNLLYKAKKEIKPVSKDHINMLIDDTMVVISIEAIPLPGTIEPFYLILFHEKHVPDSAGAPIPTKETTKRSASKDDKSQRIQQLELELLQIREDMRSITEDQESTNEELQSANEELLSSSEELQSLNEELETGKEELQSTNEELMIVNQEMLSLLEQLKQERDYAESIVETIRVPLIVLDKNMCVRSANSSFYKTFRVHESETEGALLFEISSRQWDIPELRSMLEKVRSKKTKMNDLEVRRLFNHIGERSMLFSAQEIRANGSEKLILLAIDDVTERKQVEGERQSTPS